LERDKDAFERVNSVLNQINIEYKGTSDVLHFVELFVQDEIMSRIKDNIIKPLDNLNIAAHYGCHLIRPSEILQFDDPERPESMDKIINLLGAKTVAFASKLECCGYCARLNDDIGMKLVKEKVVDLKNLEKMVDTMVAVCPACVSQYDKKERLLDRDTEVDMDIPILYLPELMAIAFGIDTEKLDLKRRSVRPTKLLEKLQV
jgi:heterodisulfide reductase subunit B